MQTQAPDGPDDAPSGRPDLDRLLDAARADDAAPPTLDDLAASAHFSKFHLSRLLREHLGFSLRDFLAALRVDRGINALVEGHDVTWSQHEAGHESASSFSRSFARHTGLAPSRYRAQLRFLAAYLMRYMDRTDPLVALYRRFPAGVHRQSVPLQLRVEDALPGAALFVALNGSPILQGPPDLGIALLGTDTYAVSEIPDGTYFVMVVEVPKSTGMRAYFQMDRNRRQLLRDPVTFPLRGPTEVVLKLRHLIPTDPPITPNIPRLFFEGTLGSLTVEESNSGQPPTADPA